MRLLLLALCCLFALTQPMATPRRAALMTKIVNIGLTYPTKPKLNSLLNYCIPTIVKNCSAGLDIETVGTNLVNELMGAQMMNVMGIFMADFNTLMAKFQNFSDCLGTCDGSPTPTDLITSMATSFMSSSDSTASGITDVAQAACDLIKKKKTNNPKMNNTAVMEPVFNSITPQINKTAINQKCVALVKGGIIGQCAMNCIKTGAKFFFNINNYSCASTKSPNP